ncbi:MAG: SgcJ/EcaC family oxidoreductase [Planctomycetaceae bacterium]|nr:MAG: SgcJ/EcaC family oxidoreductase [Planctomycetaceae bacterium]
MIRTIVATAVWVVLTHAGFAQPDNRPDAPDASAEQDSIHQRLESYVQAFNQQDAAAVAAFWSPDCISTAEDSGQRIEGREALRQHFAEFFKESPDARLVGEVTDIQIVRPDVAVIEGRTTLVLADAEPVETVFAATLVKEENQWLITNSRERDVLPLTSPQDALKDLEWLIGTWEDQTENGHVVTTIRWAPNRAFLIRSFAAYVDDQEQQGTQVIGWDPRNRQIRTWIFHSDGSFGQGTISRHDDAWMLKMSQTLSDGRTAAGTQILTRVDDNTITVQVIGETVAGELIPTADPVTVVRTADASGSSTDAAANAEGVKP